MDSLKMESKLNELIKKYNARRGDWVDPRLFVFASHCLLQEH